MASFIGGSAEDAAVATGAALGALDTVVRRREQRHSRRQATTGKTLSIEAPARIDGPGRPQVLKIPAVSRHLVPCTTGTWVGYLK